jgi:decaprenylphospho-beta-D-erythro-pentofuranosid-2-ulose 2-reductase
MKVAIIGANSDVAKAAIPIYLKSACEVVAFAHKPEELSGLNCEIKQMDVRNLDPAIFEGFDFDIVVFTVGRLGENLPLSNQALTNEIIEVNFTALVPMVSYFGQQFKEKKKGVIVGVSSVAALRGKSSSVVYSAAKAGWDSYLAGMRNYLYKDQVRVLTIRPGYIDTKMTKGFKLNPLLTASAEQVAAKIVKHSLSGNRNVVVVKAIWRPIMCIVTSIPERIFKRMSL